MSEARNCAVASLRSSLVFDLYSLLIIHAVKYCNSLSILTTIDIAQGQTNEVVEVLARQQQVRFGFYESSSSISSFSLDAT